jgi:hypothetical protein
MFTSNGSVVTDFKVLCFDMILHENKCDELCLLYLTWFVFVFCSFYCIYECKVTLIIKW